MYHLQLAKSRRKNYSMASMQSANIDSVIALADYPAEVVNSIATRAEG